MIEFIEVFEFVVAEFPDAPYVLLGHEEHVTAVGDLAKRCDNVEVFIFANQAFFEFASVAEDTVFRHVILPGFPFESEHFGAIIL